MILSGPLKPGSGQIQTNIPSLSIDPSKPFTSGGNPQVEGIPNQPNTNPQTPINPGNLQTEREAIQGDASLVIYSKFTNPKGPIIAEYCVSTYFSPSKVKFIRNEAQANPYCIEVDSSGTLHNVQAPGLIGIKVVNSNFDSVDTSNCKFYIYAKQSKSCVLNFINK